MDAASPASHEHFLAGGLPGSTRASPARSALTCGGEAVTFGPIWLHRTLAPPFEREPSESAFARAAGSWARTSVHKENCYALTLAVRSTLCAALQVPPLCRWMQWPRDRAAVRASGPKHRLSFFDPEEFDGCGGAVQWWIELRRRTLG